jgi:hypothetical protein
VNATEARHDQVIRDLAATHRAARALLGRAADEPLTPADLRHDLRRAVLVDDRPEEAARLLWRHGRLTAEREDLLVTLYQEAKTTV